MSKRAKVVVTRGKDGSQSVSVGLSGGTAAVAFRPRPGAGWTAHVRGGKAGVVVPGGRGMEADQVVRYLKGVLRDELLAELTALHDNAPDGDARGGTERPTDAEVAEILRREG